MSMKRIYRPIDKWPRELTPKDERKRSPFIRGSKWVKDANGNTNVIKGGATPLSRTWADLERELKHFEPLDGEVIIQRALRDRDIRQDGEIRADAANPKHPGVILKFTGHVAGRKTPLSFACDAFDRWEDNLRAIVLTLEHLRGADRYGVTNSGEQYRGWNALPPAIPLAMTVEEAARTMVKFAGDDAPYDGLQIVQNGNMYKQVWRIASKRYHPDNNNQAVLQEWHTLMTAKDVLDKHHGV